MFFFFSFSFLFSFVLGERPRTTRDERALTAALPQQTHAQKTPRDAASDLPRLCCRRPDEQHKQKQTPMNEDEGIVYQSSPYSHTATARTLTPSPRIRSPSPSPSPVLWTLSDAAFGTDPLREQEGARYARSFAKATGERPCLAYAAHLAADIARVMPHCAAVSASGSSSATSSSSSTTTCVARVNLATALAFVINQVAAGLFFRADLPAPAEQNTSRTHREIFFRLFLGAHHREPPCPVGV